MSVVCSLFLVFFFSSQHLFTHLILNLRICFCFLEHYAHRYILWWRVTKIKDDCVIFVNRNCFHSARALLLTDCSMPSSLGVARWPIRTKDVLMGNSFTSQSKEISIPRLRSNYRGNGKIYPKREWSIWLFCSFCGIDYNCFDIFGEITIVCSTIFSMNETMKCVLTFCIIKIFSIRNKTNLYLDLNQRKRNVEQTRHGLLFHRRQW